MSFASWLRDLAFNLRTSSGVDYHPAWQRPTVAYYWRCPHPGCNARSRGGDWNESHARQLAYEHQWRKGVGHATPEVYPGPSS